MAEKETKTIRVSSERQMSVTNLWNSFGWKLESAYDVIKPATPRSPGYHDVKLDFVRDQTRPDYNELVARQKEYEANENRQEEANWIQNRNIAGIIGGIIGAVIGGIIGGISGGAGGLFGLGVFGAALGAIKGAVNASKTFEYISLDKGALFGLFNGGINGAFIGVVSSYLSSSSYIVMTIIFAIIGALIGAIIRFILSRLSQ